jgi:hypothetical protein
MKMCRGMSEQEIEDQLRSKCWKDANLVRMFDLKGVSDQFGKESCGGTFKKKQIFSSKEKQMVRNLSKKVGSKSITAGWLVTFNYHRLKVKTVDSVLEEDSQSSQSSQKSAGSNLRVLSQGGSSDHS